MNHGFIDRYAFLQSPIHGLKPPIKLKASLGGLVLLLLLFPLMNDHNTLTALGIYGVLIAFIALISKVPITFLLSRSALVLPFSALIILVNFISGHFSASQLFETLLKSLLSIFTLLLLTSTTPFQAILKQLSHWGTPRLVILILSFMYRYFFVLAGEIEALERGVRTRHSSVRGWKRFRVYANIFGMLLVRSFERAEKVYQGMQMRGFTGDLS